LLATFFFFLIVIFLISYKTDINDRIYHYIKPDKIPLEEVVQILHFDFPFFKYLNQTQQVTFAKRVILIIYKKTFFCRDGMVIDLKVRVLLSATIAQLTFGFYNNYWLPKYKTIGVYPTVFYSRFLDVYVKGLTSPNGMLLISWDDFIHGLSTNTDKLNVGIHEFAHALYFNFFKDEYDMNFNRFNEVAHQEYLKMKKNNTNNYLRAYAATNPYEFWAVCIEHYFEDPFGFRKTLPRLYKKLSIVLKFDLAKMIEINRPDIVSEYLIGVSERT